MMYKIWIWTEVSSKDIQIYLFIVYFIFFGYFPIL